MMPKTTAPYGSSGRLIVWAVYIAMFQVVTTNSRQSTLWRLDEERGTIVSGGPSRFRGTTDRETPNHTPQGPRSHTDDMFDIITAPPRPSITVNDDDSWTLHASDMITAPTRHRITVNDDDSWTLHASDSDMCCDDCVDDDDDDDDLFGSDNMLRVESLLSISPKLPPQKSPPTEITCGKTANFTQFDHLAGIKQRFNHPIRPEPEVAYIFMKRKDAELLRTFDMTSLERRLRRAQRDTPDSAQLYNQIGNYWRIKGDTTKAIECFRKALAIRPTHTDVLLNMARALFRQDYLDDAIHLARKSLELKKSERGAWRQYLTLGEIFRAYGQFQESIKHLRLALALHPKHEQIARTLLEVESIPEVIVQKYTAWIIVSLVISSMLAILMTGDRALSLTALLKSSVIERQRRLPNGELIDAGTAEPKRHFNRAMAMRSLKGFTRSSRGIRR